jgi:hypothetical protein
MDVIYAWQSLVLAVVIVGLTQGLKTTIENVLLLRNKGTTKTGVELRAEIAMIDKAILPLFPLILGSVLAVIVPMRPEALTTYVTDHAHGSKMAYAMWGAVIGQFADYLYQRAKRLIPGGDPGRPTPTPPADPATPEPPATPDPPPPAA